MSESRDTYRFKLLFLLPFPPILEAPQGGSRVMAQLIAELAARHRVAVLYLRGYDDPPMDPVLRAACEQVIEVPQPSFQGAWAQRWQLYLRFLLGYFQGRPMWVVQWRVAALDQQLLTLAREWQPDILQIEHLVMAQYATVLAHNPVPCLLTNHEPGISVAPYLLARYPRLAKLLHWFDSQSWRRYERTMMSKMQQVVVFTEEDRRAVATYHVQTPVETISIGIKPMASPLNPLGEAPFESLFVGNFVHPPNVDAAQRLIHDIFPKVLARVPEAQLALVGAWPPPQVRHAANEHIIVTGYVPEIWSYVKRAALVVAPLRLGGGMRVKILDALAAGKAIVASPRAVQGLDLTNGKHLILAESDEHFVDAIVELSRNPSWREALGQAAFQWACDNLGWDKTVCAYEKLYRNLVNVA